MTVNPDAIPHTTDGGTRWAAFVVATFAFLVFLFLRPPMWRPPTAGVALASLAALGLAVAALGSLFAALARGIRADRLGRAAAQFALCVLVFLALRTLVYAAGLGYSGTWPRAAALVLAIPIVLATSGGRRLSTLVEAQIAALGGARRPILTAVVGLLLFGLGLTQLSGRSRQAAVTPPSPNLVIVVLDEWSADHSTLPGLTYARATTPRLAALAANGRVYTRAYSSSLSSPPSLGSFFLGIPAIELHGPYPRPVTWPMQDRSFLTEARKRGYRVTYLYSADNVSPAGVGLAYDMWHVRSPLGCTWTNRFVDLMWVCQGLMYVQRYVRPHVPPHPRETIALATRVLDRMDKSRPFILFVHVLAPHEPFRPDSTDLALLGASGRHEDTYDAYLRTADRLAAAFVEHVLTTSPHTLVMLLGDHGLRSDDVHVNRRTFHPPLVLLGESVTAGVDTSLISVPEIWARILAPRFHALAHPLREPYRIGSAVLGQHWDRRAVGTIAGDTFCWLVPTAPPARCADPAVRDDVERGNWRVATPEEDARLREAVAIESGAAPRGSTPRR